MNRATTIEYCSCLIYQANLFCQMSRFDPISCREVFEALRTEINSFFTLLQLHTLEVRQPAPLGLPMRMANCIPDLWSFTAN